MSKPSQPLTTKHSDYKHNKTDFMNITTSNLDVFDNTFNMSSKDLGTGGTFLVTTLNKKTPAAGGGSLNKISSYRTIEEAKVQTS